MRLTADDAAALSKSLVWLSSHHVPFMELPEIEFWSEKNSDLIQWVDNSITDPAVKEMTERYLNAMDVLATISLVARLAKGSQADPKIAARLQKLNEKYVLAWKEGEE